MLWAKMHLSWQWESDVILCLRVGNMLDFGYYNMDCMDGMKQFPDKFFDIAVCDPPYGRKNHVVKDRGRLIQQKSGSKIFVPSGTYEKSNWDNNPPDSTYFDELIRVSKHQIIFGVNYFNYLFPGCGRIIWDKCNDGSSQCGGEIAYCSLNDRVDIFRYMWRGMFQGKSVDEGTIQQGNKKLNEKRIHPTQKPVNLYRWIVREYIEVGWKVLDTHTGSASSLIAFCEAGLQFVAFEKDENMYRLSMERYKSETGMKNFGG